MNKMKIPFFPFMEEATDATAENIGGGTTEKTERASIKKIKELIIFSHFKSYAPANAFTEGRTFDGLLKTLQDANPSTLEELDAIAKEYFSKPDTFAEDEAKRKAEAEQRKVKREAKKAEREAEIALFFGEI